MFRSLAPYGEDSATKETAQKSFNKEERVKHDDIYASRETYTFEYIGAS